jgi:hypothetical protein
MINCVKCGSANQDDSEFCDQCGQKIDKEGRCPKCGGEVRETANGEGVCAGCGAVLIASAPAPSKDEKPETADRSCPRCGTTLVPGNPSCPRCGAPAVSPSAAPPAAPPAFRPPSLVNVVPDGPGGLRNAFSVGLAVFYVGFIAYRYFRRPTPSAVVRPIPTASGSASPASRVDPNDPRAMYKQEEDMEARYLQPIPGYERVDTADIAAQAKRYEGKKVVFYGFYTGQSLDSFVASGKFGGTGGSVRVDGEALSTESKIGLTNTLGPFHKVMVKGTVHDVSGRPREGRFGPRANVEVAADEIVDLGRANPNPASADANQDYSREREMEDRYQKPIAGYLRLEIPDLVSDPKKYAEKKVAVYGVYSGQSLDSFYAFGKFGAGGRIAVNGAGLPPEAKVGLLKTLDGFHKVMIKGIFHQSPGVGVDADEVVDLGRFNANPSPLDSEGFAREYQKEKELEERSLRTLAGYEKTEIAGLVVEPKRYEDKKIAFVGIYLPGQNFDWFFMTGRFGKGGVIRVNGGGLSPAIKSGLLKTLDGTHKLLVQGTLKAAPPLAPSRRARMPRGMALLAPGMGPEVAADSVVDLGLVDPRAD